MIVAVSGCPRGDTSYTEDTVKSLIYAGASDVYVYDDVSLTGSGPACHALISILSERFPGEDILLTEDDVMACKNAVPAAAMLGFPVGCEALSFYFNALRLCDEYPRGIPLDYSDSCTNKNFRNVPPRAGIYLQPCDKFQFSQAMKLSAAAIRCIAETPWPDVCTFPNIDQGAIVKMSPKNIRDTALGWYLSHISKFVGQVVPNWFEHTGDVSAAMLIHQFERLSLIRSGNWLGVEHDALADVDRVVAGAVYHL